MGGLRKGQHRVQNPFTSFYGGMPDSSWRVSGFVPHLTLKSLQNSLFSSNSFSIFLYFLPFGLFRFSILSAFRYILPFGTFYLSVSSALWYFRPFENQTCGIFRPSGILPHGFCHLFLNPSIISNVSINHAHDMHAEQLIYVETTILLITFTYAQIVVSK